MLINQDTSIPWSNFFQYDKSNTGCLSALNKCKLNVISGKSPTDTYGGFLINSGIQIFGTSQAKGATMVSNVVCRHLENPEVNDMAFARIYFGSYLWITNKSCDNTVLKAVVGL